MMDGIECFYVMIFFTGAVSNGLVPGIMEINDDCEYYARCKQKTSRD